MPLASIPRLAQVGAWGQQPARHEQEQEQEQEQKQKQEQEQVLGWQSAVLGQVPDWAHSLACLLSRSLLVLQVSGPSEVVSGPVCSPNSCGGTCGLDSEVEVEYAPQGCSKEPAPNLCRPASAVTDPWEVFSSPAASHPETEVRVTPQGCHS